MRILAGRELVYYALYEVHNGNNPWRVSRKQLNRHDIADRLINTAANTASILRFKNLLIMDPTATPSHN